MEQKVGIQLKNEIRPQLEKFVDFINELNPSEQEKLFIFMDTLRFAKGLYKEQSEKSA